MLQHPTSRLFLVNELAWYALKGDPRWDGDQLWTAMGHLYKGGMWFKKSAYITGFNNNLAPNGQDLQVKSNYSIAGTVSHTLPSASEASQFFYLPCLGYYTEGKLMSMGSQGYYWSSDGNPWGELAVGAVAFNMSNIWVMQTARNLGMIGQPFSDFGED